MGSKQLDERPIHLGLGATAVAEPRFTGELSWYEGYGKRHGGDGFEGRLVSQHSFSSPWELWEMHPNGAEVVICIAGTLDLIQELPDGVRSTTRLEPGHYAINPPGVWHTADVDGEATAIFITAGAGTEHRPRN